MKTIAQVTVRSGTVTVNGKTFTGKSVSIDAGGVVIVDGVQQGGGALVGPVTVTVQGDAERVETAAGDITVHGSAGSIHSAAGDVTAGPVGGNIQTMSGDVDCGPVQGNVSTMSGDIKRRG